MKITDIMEYKKNKYKIFTDECLEFVLYKGDLKRFGIEKNMVISLKQKELLLKELLPHRAKERCMKLLQRKDYTVAEIKNKLVGDGYPREVIELTVNDLLKYRYLDDERYVNLYFQNKSLSKSQKMIIMELQRRGIAKEIIYKVLEKMESDLDESGDLYCIRKLLDKKKYDDRNASFEEKEKIKVYLYRKGFELSDISTCMKGFVSERIE